MARILDSNVLAAAAGQADHLGPDCEIAAIQELVRARDDLVLLDSGDAIMGEYRAKCQPRRQAGPADLFVRWLFQVRSDRRFCRLVEVDQYPSGDYVDYPTDHELASFDRDDRVYVAVAVASGVRPTIVNATDSDWDSIAQVLRRRYRINVRRVCS